MGGLVSIAEDITEHERRETAARATEEILHRIADNMRDLVSEIDADGFYRYASPSFERVLGYEPSAIVGTSVLSYLHPDDASRMVAELKQGSADGAEHEIEYRFRHADGRYLWFSSLSRPLFDSGGRFLGHVGGAREVTERRRADEEVRRLNEELEKRVAERTAQLEAANRELEAFSYSVSHDLRAPLRAINGFSRIVQEKFADLLPSEGLHLLRAVRENTMHMGLLIDGLLSLSRFGRQTLRFKAIEVTELVQEVIESLADQRVGREVEIVVEPLPTCEGDPILLRQVWINLIANAIKFSRSRSHARIVIGAENRNGRTTYFVKDNGVGFDMRYADKLFGVFQRLHRSEEYEGAGIGLAQMYSESFTAMVVGYRRRRFPTWGPHSTLPYDGEIRQAIHGRRAASRASRSEATEGERKGSR